MKNFKLGCLMAMSALFLIFGCQKEENALSISRVISLEEIIDHCNSINHQGVSLRTNHRTPLKVLPDFSTLVRSTNQFGDPVFIGYLDKYSLDSIIKPTQDKGALIAFFKDSLGDIRSELMLWDKKPGSYFDQSYFLIYPQSNFTGITLLINDYDRVEKIGAYKNGILTKFENLTLHISGRNVYDFKHLSTRCDCSNGCNLSWWCMIYCDIKAVVWDGTGAVISDIGNWLWDGLENIYYWWADGEWKGSSWIGDPGPGNSGFSGGTWGGTWSGTGGDHGGTSFSNDRDWEDEKLKCLLQQFNDLEDNGETSNLNFPELCTLHGLLQFGDCEYKMLYKDQALANNIMAFLKNQNNAPSAVANVKKALLTACSGPNAGNDLNSYLNCALKNKNINLDFDKYMASIRIIEQFLENHSNDPISSNIAAQAIKNLCNGTNNTKTLENEYCIQNLAAGSDKAGLLDFYYHTTLLDPCTGEDIDKDEIFSRLCNNNEMSLAGLDAALGEVDYIVEVLINTCPKLDCIWKKIKSMNSESGDNLICQFMNNDPSVFLVCEYDNSLPSTTNGRTYWNASGVSRIVINDDDCFNLVSPLYYAGTIFHEFIHAEIYKDLYSMDYIQGFGKDLGTIWNEYMRKNYHNLDPNNNNHHTLMAEVFINRIAFLLYELNGKIGTVEDYKYLAWLGMKDMSGKNLISEKNLGLLKTKFITNILNNENSIRC